jgi:energy-coupling factor transporter transmembrane protein EcfT
VRAARPDPRAALLFGACGSAAALTGPVAAAGVLVLALLLALASRLEARRFLPLAGSFAIVLAAVPVAPGPAARALLQGLAVSAAVVVAVTLARWDRLVAAMQSLGAGRGTVAFLAIAFSHVEAAGRDARRALEALRLRGGFRGVRGLAGGASILLARELRRALERADRTADALALRGFDGRLPASPRGRLRPVDRAAVAASLLAIVLAAGSLAPWSR